MYFHTDLAESGLDPLTWALTHCKARGLVHEGVYAAVFTWVGSRSRAGAARFKLQADMHTPGRRRINAGTSRTVDRHDLPYAATYDEWGWVLSAMFHVDPRAHCGTGRYASEADFHAQTHDRYRLPKESPVDITDYTAAEAFLAGAADLYNRTVRGIKATKIVRRIDGIAVCYHDTDVVTYHPDGDVTLNTGGWLTQTTANRMSEFTRLRIWPKEGRWMVCPIPGPNRTPLWDQSLPLTDGIRLNRDGHLVDGVNFAQVASEDAWNERVRNLLRKARRKYFAISSAQNNAEVPREPECEHCEANYEQNREIRPGTERDHYLQHLAAIVAGMEPNHWLARCAVSRAGYPNDEITPSWRMLRPFFIERLMVGNVVGAPNGRRPASFDPPATWQRGA